MFFAPCALERVNRDPPRVHHDLHFALPEEILEPTLTVCSGQDSRPGILEQVVEVSVASFLFVPITPVGPRLIQPAAYTPGISMPESSTTRPPAFGIVPVASSKGVPDSGTPR